MHRIYLAFGLCGLLFACLTNRLGGQPIETNELAAYRQAGLEGGDPARGKALFESEAVGCQKCHAFKGDERRAGPDLGVIGDKYGREQLVQSVLEPNATIHPDYGTIVATTTDGKVHTGVLLKRTDAELQLLDADGKLVRLPSGRDRPGAADGHVLDARWSAQDLEGRPVRGPDRLSRVVEATRRRVAARRACRARSRRSRNPSGSCRCTKTRCGSTIRSGSSPYRGASGAFLVVEQKTRKIWRFEPGEREPRKELFVDLSNEATTGEFEGVVCVAFHPRFVENRKYYVNYHVRNQGSFFSPVIVERQATPDLRRDAGVPSRRLLQIHAGHRSALGRHAGVRPGRIPVYRRG